MAKSLIGALAARFTYANVASSLALFLVLTGGAAYAATELAANSVGTKQLKNDAVTSPKVLDRSLLAKDFKSGQLSAGPRGATGSPGPQGPQGEPGQPGGLSGSEVVYSSSSPGPGGTKSAQADCPSGKKATGGGHIVTGPTNARITVSTPAQVSDPVAWYVEAKENPYTGADWTLYAYVVCADAG